MTPRGVMVALVLASLSLPAGVHSSPPRSPLELRLQLHASRLHWELVAHEDVLLVETTLRSMPEANRAPLPPFPGRLRAGESQSGIVTLIPPCHWLEVRIRLRTAGGEEWTGASAGLRSVEAKQPMRRLFKPRGVTRTGSLQALFLFEDRLLDEQGYTGTTQTLPLRGIDVDLLGAAGQVLAQGRLTTTGELQLSLPAEARGTLRLRLWSSTRQHPDFDLAVLERDEESGRFRRHALDTPAFDPDEDGTDLGTYVLEDPDGFGRLQAFHVLDVALDAFAMLSTPAWLGRAPQDSLRFLWGPDMRIRSTASFGSVIQLASPAGGDTDGWSDAVILHEVAHFVANRYGRNDSAGGLHFLGDVEQDLTLAFSEGWATTFACVVRAWRAAERRTYAGAAADANVSWYVDGGLPPPLGTAGGLQLAWDLETSTWPNGRPLLRDGIGSESNVAAILWDLVDDRATPDASPGRDDDQGSVEVDQWWRALRDLRTLSPEKRVTLEDYWFAARFLFGDEASRFLQRVFLEEGRVEFIPDAAEPDDGDEQARTVAPGFPARVPGGVVIDEIDPGTSPAVEISNRSSQWISLQGWRLIARRNGATTNPGLSLRFPPGVHLAPAARLVIHGEGRHEDGTVRHLIAPHWTMPWFPETDGALVLEDDAGRTQDFVRWSSSEGTASEMPVPEDTGFQGELLAPGYGKTLQRAARLDEDVAGNFFAAPSTLGAPNDVEILHRTFYPAGDRDDFRFVARRDGAYTLQTLGLRNGAEPQLQLSAAGRPQLIPRRDAPGRATEITLWLQAGELVQGTLQHQGERTRFGAYDLALYAEPEAQAPHAPEGIHVRAPTNEGSGVTTLSWWNGARYDSTSLWVDGSRQAVLPGTATEWELPLPSGVHRVRLQAHIGGFQVDTPELIVQTGRLPETWAEDFEFLSKEQWEIEEPWGLAPAPGRPGLALTESPAGDYAANQRVAVRSRQAVQVQPGATLCFDHICIVRPEDSAVVQVSEDWGARWITLGRWNLNDHRGDGEASRWNDGQADGEDWVHECLPLEAFEGERVQVRFLFQSDVYAGAEGWWIDALRLGVASAQTPRFRLDAAVPNPFNARTQLRFAIEQPGPVFLRLFDARGRLVRVLVHESLSAGEHSVLWDGRSAAGLPMASGVYFVQLQNGSSQAERKIVLLR